MSQPTPRPESTPMSPLPVDESQVRNWLRLRAELAELHARLEYLKLMLKLGVS